jgi:hypothetical protein
VISKEKKSLLHGAPAKARALPEYRFILVNETGYDSCAAPNFSDADFEKVLKHFQASGFWVKRKFEPKKTADGKATITRVSKK